MMTRNLSIKIFLALLVSFALQRCSANLSEFYSVLNSTSQCPKFTSSHSNSALFNYQSCNIYACPGTVMTMATCDEFGDFTCSGDTYLKLYDNKGSLLSSNDDMFGSCGICSSISYTFNLPCQYYTLREGCFEVGSCSGTVHIISNKKIVVDEDKARTLSPSRSTISVTSTDPISINSQPTESVVNCPLY